MTLQVKKTGLQLKVIWVELISTRRISLGGGGGSVMYVCMHG